jgi:hypothetical protein
MEVVMAYRAADPWAVSFTFDPLAAQGFPSTWVFARELLSECFTFRTTFERHDVVVERLNLKQLRVRLGGRRRNGKEAVSHFVFPMEAVRAFLGETVRVVPIGHEESFTDWASAERVFDLPPGALTGVAPA